MRPLVPEHSEMMLADPDQHAPHGENGDLPRPVGTRAMQGQQHGDQAAEHDGEINPGRRKVEQVGDVVPLRRFCSSSATPGCFRKACPCTGVPHCFMPDKKTPVWGGENNPTSRMDNMGNMG